MVLGLKFRCLPLLRRAFRVSASAHVSSLTSRTHPWEGCVPAALKPSRSSHVTVLRMWPPPSSRSWNIKHMQESARVSRTAQVTRPLSSLPRPRPDKDQPSRGLLHAPCHYSPREVGDLGWHRLLFPTLVLYVIKTHRPVPHVCCCVANRQETSQPKIAFKSYLGPHGSLQPPSFLCFVTKLLEHRPRSGTLTASLCPGVPLAPRPPGSHQRHP